MQGTLICCDGNQEARVCLPRPFRNMVSSARIRLSQPHPLPAPHYPLLHLDKVLRKRMSMFLRRSRGLESVELGTNAHACMHVSKASHALVYSDDPHRIALGGMCAAVHDQHLFIQPVFRSVGSGNTAPPNIAFALVASLCYCPNLACVGIGSCQMFCGPAVSS